MSLHQVTQQTVQALFAQAHEKGLTLRNEVPADLPPVLADADRLQQVITNLIANAVKFTHQGYIAVGAQLLLPGSVVQGWQSPDPAALAVLVFVRDTGVGIAPAYMPRLFSRFQQAEGDVLSDRPKGTGLGLAICKEIVNHYGGVIWAESTPGQGSTFSLVLPIK